MRFIIDAQLPIRLSNWLCVQGHDAIHTLSLPEKNHTSDRSIADMADESDRIVVSKDSDFTTLKLLTGKPKKLLIIKTGNLGNDELLKIFEVNLKTIEKLFLTFEVVEISSAMVAGGNLD